jgi:hypothetical protein
MGQANTKWKHIHLERHKNPLAHSPKKYILHAATPIFPSAVKDVVGLSNINWKHSNSANFAFLKNAGYSLLLLFSIAPR